MGIKKKWVPGCGCCGACRGVNVTDAFSSATTDWTANDSGYLWSISSGVLNATYDTSGTSSVQYYSRPVSGISEGCTLSVKAKVGYSSLSTSTGGSSYTATAGIMLDDSAFPYSYALFARAPYSDYGLYHNGTFQKIYTSLVNNVVYEIRLKQNAGGSATAKYIINGTTVATHTDTYTMPTTVKVGFMVSVNSPVAGKVHGYYDDFAAKSTS